MSEEKQKDKVLDIEVQEIELVQFDPKPFVNKEAVVNVAEAREGIHGPYVYFEAVLTDEDAIFNDEQIKATAIYGLHKDKDGVVGFGKDTKLGHYLKFNGVKAPKEMIGQKVVTKIVLAKDGKAYLTF